MVTLRDDGWAKARPGITPAEEILRVTQVDT
jgi:type II secretory ATPase GspE/PulE/Tfp pilus assembly ATPase PilB-like protein